MKRSDRLKKAFAEHFDVFDGHGKKMIATMVGVPALAFTFATVSVDTRSPEESRVQGVGEKAYAALEADLDWLEATAPKSVNACARRDMNQEELAALQKEEALFKQDADAFAARLFTSPGIAETDVKGLRNAFADRIDQPLPDMLQDRTSWNAAWLNECHAKYAQGTLHAGQIKACTIEMSEPERNSWTVSYFGSAMAGLAGTLGLSMLASGWRGQIARREEEAEESRKRRELEELKSILRPGGKNFPSP